jgi:hypothetical protein
LGIGADKQWNAYFKAYLEKVKDPLQNDAEEDIVWRARTDEAVPYPRQLGSIIMLPSTNVCDISVLLILIQVGKSTYLLKMLTANTSNDITLNKLVLHALDVKTVKQSPVGTKSFDRCDRLSTKNA